jgi:hypothetical protein
VKADALHQVAAKVISFVTASVVIVILVHAFNVSASSGVSGCIVSCPDTSIVSNIFCEDTYFCCLPIDHLIFLSILSLVRKIVVLNPSSSTS